MKLKRIIEVFLTAAMLVTLAACGVVCHIDAYSAGLEGVNTAAVVLTLPP